MGKRREGRAGGLVQSGLQQQRGAADPPAGNGVHHGGNLQGRCQQLPLPEAEIGVGPAGRKSLLLRQDPRRRVQGIGEWDRLPEAQLLCHGADGIGPQRLPQPDEVAVAALFQRAGQIHLTMGDAARTAEDPAIHRAPAGAGVDKAALPCLQRRCRHHRLEHRAHGIALERPFQQGAVRGVQAGRNVFRIIAGAADAGPHLGVGGVQHQDAAALHRLVGHGFGGLLDLPGKGQLHPHGPAVGGGEDGLGPQLSLGVDGAEQGIPRPAAGEQIIKGGFQPGGTVALAIEIPQQLHCQRGGRASPCRWPAGNAQRGNIPVHFQQKRGCGVPLLVERRLPGGIGVGEQAGIAALPGHAEGHPAGGLPREELAPVIIKIAPPSWQVEGDHALRRRPGPIGRVGAEPVQAADHRRKAEQQGSIQDQHPFAGHENAPSPA